MKTHKEKKYFQKGYSYYWEQWPDEPITCSCILELKEHELEAWATCPNCLGYGIPPIPLGELK